MKPICLLLPLCLLTGIVITSCKKQSSSPKSPDKAIDSLNLLKGNGAAFNPGDLAVTITPGDSILVSVPAFTDTTALEPIISITGKTISPASGVEQNFSSPVIYTVTAADGSQVQYTVIVTVRGHSLCGRCGFWATPLDCGGRGLLLFQPDPGEWDCLCG
jgi:hypothetical protein